MIEDQIWKSPGPERNPGAGKPPNVARLNGQPALDGPSLVDLSAFSCFASAHVNGAAEEAPAPVPTQSGPKYEATVLLLERDGTTLLQLTDLRSAQQFAFADMTVDFVDFLETDATVREHLRQVFSPKSDPLPSLQEFNPESCSIIRTQISYLSRDPAGGREETVLWCIDKNVAVALHLRDVTLSRKLLAALAEGTEQLPVCAPLAVALQCINNMTAVNAVTADSPASNYRAILHEAKRAGGTSAEHAAALSAIKNDCWSMTDTSKLLLTALAPFRTWKGCTALDPDTERLARMFSDTEEGLQSLIHRLQITRRSSTEQLKTHDRMESQRLSAATHTLNASMHALAETTMVLTTVCTGIFFGQYLRGDSPTAGALSVAAGIIAGAVVAARSTLRRRREQQTAAGKHNSYTPSH